MSAYTCVYIYVYVYPLQHTLKSTDARLSLGRLPKPCMSFDTCPTSTCALLRLSSEPVAMPLPHC
eukprot:383908-Lingulodinium_polyedra.AAC.1